MTASEKEAKELIEWFLPYVCTRDGSFEDEIKQAKQCAIKVCEEKIKSIVELSEGQNGYWLDIIQKQIDIKTAINNYEQQKTNSR